MSPTSFSFLAAGGTGSIAVSIPDGCTWTAQAQAAWLSVTSGSTGTGAGTVGFTAAANPTEAGRIGSLAVAGQTVAVSQAGRDPNPSCTYAISVESATFPKDGGGGTVTVTAPDGCGWTASSDASWLTIQSGGTGSGAGAVNYLVANNREAAVRTGALTIETRTLTITQEPDLGACLYSVAPQEFSPCITPAEMTAAITTQDVCPWTATPDASWIAVASPSGVGSDTIRFSVSGNFDAPREGRVLVRWPAPTAGQNLRVAQAGCVYGVSQNAISVPAGGGSFSFDVVQETLPNECGGPLQDKCQWSATPDAAWIVVTTSSPQVGDNPVRFNVLANTSSSPRTGTITVRDKVVTITQAGQ